MHTKLTDGDIRKHTGERMRSVFHNDCPKLLDVQMVYTYSKLGKKSRLNNTINIYLPN